MAIKITKGNKNDLSAILTMIKDLKCKLFANKGYIFQDLMTYLRRTYDYLLVLEKI